MDTLETYQDVISTSYLLKLALACTFRSWPAEAFSLHAEDG
jgi:hypothetical protein